MITRGGERDGRRGSYIVLGSVAQSCPTFCSPMGYRYPNRLLCPWGFSRQEYWSGLPCSPPGDLPNPGIEPRSPALQGDACSIPGSVRYPGGGTHGNPPQYSCLNNTTDRGPWQPIVRGVGKSWTWLSNLTTTTCIKQVSNKDVLYSTGKYSCYLVTTFFPSFNS